MNPEKSSQIVPTGSKHLFDLNSQIDAMHDKDVETIIAEACARDRDQHFKRKVTAYALRESNYGHQDKTTQAKVDERLKIRGLVLDSFSVLAAIGSTIAGGQTIPGGLMQVAHQAFEKTSNHVTKQTDASVTILDHRFERLRSIASDHGQQIQGTEREWEQTAAMIDRLMQTQQRTAEMMVTSAA